MPPRANATTRSPTHAVRVQSGKLLLPDDVAARIINMFPTEEGTLRRMWGPCPYVPGYTGGEFVLTSYNDMHGVGHGFLKNGEREVLLVHHGDVLWSFQGWTRGYEVLVGTSGQLSYDLVDDLRPAPPTQFVFTPTGVIILFQRGERPLFYDGEVILPLGYDRRPGPPTGLGPTASDSTAGNDGGYNFDGASGWDHANTNGGMHPAFKSGRLGTVRIDPAGNAVTGILEDSSYRCETQWIDRWANLSPVSARSNRVHIAQELPGGSDVAAALLKNVCWTAVQKGPDGTVGRILGRTQDEKHSGTTRTFVIPPNAAGGVYSFGATIPDNISEAYPDNTPDAWLIEELKRPVPVSPFTRGCLAFGRLWAAGWLEHPSKVHPSMPGRYGTFLEGEERFPDPGGARVLAVHATPAGVLVLTAQSTVLITPNDRGDGFRDTVLSSTVGIIAPDSIKTLPTGETVWLGRDGFYIFDGQSVGYISSDIEYLLQRLNTARAVAATAAIDTRTGSYRCWFSLDGSAVNNHGIEFDGEGFREIDHLTNVVAVCAQQGHVGAMLMAGKVPDTTPTVYDGIWVLDHETRHFDVSEVTGTIETAWLTASRSDDKKSPQHVFLWLRETVTDDTDVTGNGTLTVTVYRDWRTDTSYTETCRLYESADPPPFYNGTLLAGTLEDPAGGTRDATWVRRRPFWVKVPLHAPSAEVFKLKFEASVDWEFIGFSFEEVPEPGRARMSP